jgi:hypothetical protein
MEDGGVLAALLALLAQLLCAGMLLSHSTTDGLDLRVHNVAEVSEGARLACVGPTLTWLKASSPSPNSLPTVACRPFAVVVN